MKNNVIRIGGACGFWGESALATPQLLQSGNLDFLVYDYLAEITMSLLARARAKDSNLGYATDFIDAVLKPNLPEIARQGVRLIANAGGVNPQACAAAARDAIAEAGLALKVAVVTGDDLISETHTLAERGCTEMFSGAAFPEPERLASINAYLGAFPIAEALAQGADLVITGRCVDSAVTLGACIHAFGWEPNDLDRLAGGSLAGHLLECGPQTTGGNFTDWHLVADSLEGIGYPITEISADGHFVITKPENTGGLVSRATVAEQLLYEIGDPQAYVLPDVVCDFSQVELSEEGPNRVRVSGAVGHPAPPDYKVCATYADGFRGGQLLAFNGFEAETKARCFAEAAFARARSISQKRRLPDFSETSIEVLGGSPVSVRPELVEGQTPLMLRQACPEPSRRDQHERGTSGYGEVTLKIAARHPDAKGVGLLLKEITGLALAAPPGLSIFAGGRPKPSPVVRLFSFLLPKTEVPITVECDGAAQTFALNAAGGSSGRAVVRPPEPASPDTDEPLTEVPLIKLAWGRSGDKGDSANIGVIARQPEFLPYLWVELTEAAVAEYFAKFLQGRVERFLLPGIDAINFVLHEVLGGGGIASLRHDAQGKGYAQRLLAHPVRIPESLARTL